MSTPQDKAPPQEGPRFRVARVITLDEPPTELPGFLVVDTTGQFGATLFDTPDKAKAIAARWNKDYPPLAPQEQITHA